VGGCVGQRVKDWHVTGRISDCLNKFLLDVLGCAVLNCDDFLLQSENLSTVGRTTPRDYSVFY
jgi:hypothetical protein